MRSKIGIGALGVVVAFLLATNPVVVNAAGQITSGQIQNNTIKSKDIKDNQVKGSDVKESSLGTVPSATDAANATNLNSLPAATYLDRVAHSSTISDGALADTEYATVVAPISLTVPAGANFVRVTGNVSMGGAAALATLWYARDAETCVGASGLGWDRRVQMSSQPNRDNGTIDSVEKVAPGVHQFILCARPAGAAASVFNASLTVETVAGNGTGGATRPAEARSSGNATKN